MTQRRALAVRGRLARGVLAAVVLLSLVVLFAPASDVPSAPAGVDKLVHAGLFAALAFTGRWAGVRTAVLVPLLVGYAAMSEVVQGSALLGRSMSAADWVADVVGVLLGLGAWAVVTRQGPAPR